jgi:hypothetical protein
MSFLVRALIVILALLGISALFRRRKQNEPGEDVGREPDSTTLAAPDLVELGTDTIHLPGEDWHDLSDRRKLLPGEYHAAADEPETDPEPLS